MTVDDRRVGRDPAGTWWGRGALAALAVELTLGRWLPVPPALGGLALLAGLVALAAVGWDRWRNRHLPRAAYELPLPPPVRAWTDRVPTLALLGAVAVGFYVLGRFPDLAEGWCLAVMVPVWAAGLLLYERAEGPL